MLKKFTVKDIVFLAIILLLIIFGYKRNSKKEDE